MMQVEIRDESGALSVVDIVLSYDHRVMGRSWKAEIMQHGKPSVWGEGSDIARAIEHSVKRLIISRSQRG